MCLTLAQSRSIHHQNVLKGGQALTPASGHDINDFCGQPVQQTHYIYLQFIGQKSNALPENNS